MSKVPIYTQLVEEIQKHIHLRLLQPNEKIPSVRELAQMITVNPNTIQKAYRVLEESGYIYSIPGKGSFVSRVKSHVYDEQRQQLIDEMIPIVEKANLLDIDVQDLIYEVTNKLQKEGAEINEYRNK